MEGSLFRQHLSMARTFVEQPEIDYLHSIGLARGGSLDNAIVVNGTSVLNPAGLRHPHEFVRHKMLDAVGDLYMAGGMISGQFRGHKSAIHSITACCANCLQVPRTGIVRPLAPPPPACRHARHDGG